MKFILTLISIVAFSTNAFTIEKGQTEITTEDGVEVFQNEKYYLLKKNVEIVSEAFKLNADEVKINFDQSLYDIVELNAEGKVKFDSPNFKLVGSGENLNLLVKIEKLKVYGFDSKFKSDEIKMFSDGFIEINNLSGEFSLKGENSKLINENIIIKAESIDGIFSNNSGKKQVTLLKVIDKTMSYAKNNDTEMYAKKINYDEETAIIELIDSVTIIRNEEKITGDYGTLDTKNNSYKIKSSNDTKVKVVIQNNE